MAENRHAPLIERLQASTGPSREIDGLIAAAVEPNIFDAPGFAVIRPVPPFRVDAEGVLRFEGGGIMCMSYIPRYTASIDAALAMAATVLPISNIRTNVDSFGNEATVTWWRDGFTGASRTQGVGHGTNPAIALCVAILMAHGAMNG